MNGTMLTDPVEVSTVNSVYLVEPIKDRNFSGYRVEKIKDLSGGYSGNFPVGSFVEAESICLEIGKPMFVGAIGFSTSRVDGIKYAEPHH